MVMAVPAVTGSALRWVLAQPVRPHRSRTKARAETGKRRYAYSHSASPYSRPVSRDQPAARIRR
ncbi:hypothetical protein OEIGOIKO_00145 [Streptomyces chrestomyceticus JCM 4735]|uniref:Uncharacterized protein n=1 Tax=Streptomyces chrestomyceticus JCM 4735 TaxID=1306181 RepID=A0A7U9KPH4_9ACTN|nr:hypothetical protein OEIGOIKO_00145 [Streptomyces chrestomyceticus JCM 4735]